MPTILGIAGSLRSKSYNAALLRAAVELCPAGTTLEPASIRDVPLYDGDREAESGVPDVVEALKQRLARADGLLLVTPEYNNSLPGVLKNAIDWLSRPPRDIPHVFGDRPVAVIGASPGRFGAILAQTAWLPVVRTLGMRPWFGPKLAVSDAGKVFGEGGRIVDERVRALVRDFMAGFAAFVALPR